MKAIVVSQPGGPDRLELRDVPDPAPGAHQILIDVHATALNRADLLQRRGLYPAPPGETDILGLECAGVVSAVGADVSAVSVGDRVMALLAGGGYAERVVVHERLAMPIPKSLGFKEAAAIPEAFLTASEALFSVARLEPNEWVLIHAAAGGVGSAALQLGLEQGAHVLCSAGSDEKLERIRELGASATVNYKTGDFSALARELTQDRGLDVILDFIGAAYWDKHMSCIGSGGRLVSIGLLGGSRVDLDLSRVLRHRLQILGIVMRSRNVEEKSAITQRFVRRWLPLFEDGRLRTLIDSVYPLADAAQAHERMEQNLNIGKIVLSVR
jgi:putative PIG3 family NAD(P)H quinone oxidoreductase